MSLTSPQLRTALRWWPAGIVPLIEALDYRVVDLATEALVDVDGEPATLHDVVLRLMAEQVHVMDYIQTVAREANGEVPPGTVAGWTGPGDRVIPFAERAAALWNGGADGDRFPLDVRRMRYLDRHRPGTLHPVLRKVGLVARFTGYPGESSLHGPGGEVVDMDEALRRVEARPELAKVLRETLYQCYMQVSRSGDIREMGMP
ncbi:MAG TPA: hypothetical protein VF228_11245 [Iamia sp.]